MCVMQKKLLNENVRNYLLTTVSIWNGIREKKEIK